LDKLLKAVKQTGIKQVAIAGGVSANSGLRDRIKSEGEKRGWTTFIPEFKFTTDNAAMIAITGMFKFQQGLTTPLDVAPISRALDYKD
jgi:N6-L-threonylcarbamoyladenine synthase